MGQWERTVAVKELRLPAVDDGQRQGDDDELQNPPSYSMEMQSMRREQVCVVVWPQCILSFVKVWVLFVLFC